MKKFIVICFSILLSSSIFYSCKPDDQKLHKEVETVLTAYNGISSSVKDGVLTLHGTVDSEEAKMAIEKAAGAIKGIKSVANDITVKIPEPPVVINHDDVLKTTIQTALTAIGHKDLGIDIKDGEVKLTGSVKKADLTKIMQVVNEAKPKKVINELKIK